MISRKELSEIVSRLDAEMMDVYVATGKAGLPAWAARYGVSEEDMVHVAMQRALRALMNRRGEEIPTTTERIATNDAEKEQMREGAALWVDGFAAGLQVARPIKLLPIPDGERRSDGP